MCCVSPRSTTRTLPRRPTRPRCTCRCAPCACLTFCGFVTLHAAPHGLNGPVLSCAVLLLIYVSVIVLCADSRGAAAYCRGGRERCVMSLQLLCLPKLRRFVCFQLSVLWIHAHHRRAALLTLRSPCIASLLLPTRRRAPLAADADRARDAGRSGPAHARAAGCGRRQRRPGHSKCVVVCCRAEPVLVALICRRRCLLRAVPSFRPCTAVSTSGLFIVATVQHRRAPARSTRGSSTSRACPSRSGASPARACRLLLSACARFLRWTDGP